MNRILEVDPDLCTALVEPGVTYQQLYDYLREKKLPLWFSCPAPSAIAGPVGNMVDRGVGYTPYGEHFPVLLRHGGGARRRPFAHRHGLDAELQHRQVFKWGYGPTLTASSRSRISAWSQDGHVADARAAGLPALLHPVPDEADITKIVVRCARCASRW